MTDGSDSYRPGSRVGLVIPVRNRWDLLAETIASLQSQTLAAWHAWVVDDDSDTPAPPDGPWEDTRITLIRRHEGVGGAPRCRNIGLESASADYVVFIDSDDLLAPFCLEERVRLMDSRPDLGFAVFPCVLFRERCGDMRVLWNVDTGEDDLDRFLRGDSPWGVHSVMWRSDAVAKVGPWDESLLSWQDVEFHVRALAIGLRYEKAGESDCFWRMPRRDTIGRSSVDPDHLRSHEVLARSVWVLLREQGRLNPRRQALLAGLHFWIADQWAAKGFRRRAVQCWNRARSRGLVSAVIFAEGSAMLLARGRARIARWASAYRRRRWSADLYNRRSSTFRRLEMEPGSRIERVGSPGTLDAAVRREDS